MSLSLACRVYFPSRSVTVPIVVPLINTFAPIRGSLASLSITVPLTVCVCAYNAVTNTPNRNVRKKVKIRLIRLDFEVRSLLDFCFQIK